MIKKLAEEEKFQSTLDRLIKNSLGTRYLDYYDFQYFNFVFNHSKCFL